MSMQDVAAVAEIIAALGVLLSLIFVGLQVRQNTQAQRVLAVESLSAAIAAINVPAMDSPALGDALSIVMRDWRAATRDQRIIAHYFLFSFFKLHETAWYQHRSGALDDTQWAGWETQLLLYYHSPGVHTDWWPKRRHAFSPEFQGYLAGTRKPLGASTLADIFDAAPPETSA